LVEKKIIVWGGFWDDRSKLLELSELNSHASVNCYFLTKALERHFNVIQLPSFESIDAALEHEDAVGVISCFQAGFTRLRAKSPLVFSAIKKTFPGKLGSIVDLVSLQRYAEDFLFTVLPLEASFKEGLKRRLCGAKVRYIGWNAAPEYCFPEDVGTFDVFLDHGHYAGTDYTGLYVSALNRATLEFGQGRLKVYVQGNEGVKLLDAPYRWDEEAYQRAAKVAWEDMQSFYRKCSLFCVTHQESAGLGAIEAAMCGAKLIVPNNNGTLISKSLLDTGVEYDEAPCDEMGLYRVIVNNADRTIEDRKNIHQKLSSTHSWNRAADRIAVSDFAR
jgi:glycosyltransferase involved in cell wall biosynthesis|tara:strand:- start:45904 stop:46899 length:996 start_codon:yes stop_codon:yes gene_type:complete